jgi:hypothetical protein
VKERLDIDADWQNEMFKDVQNCLENHSCSVAIDHVDMQTPQSFLVSDEENLLRLVENPMVFEHESCTDLILAINHLTEEVKARGDLSTLPHQILIISQKISSVSMRSWFLNGPDTWNIQKTISPSLFSLAIRKNPLDDSASVIVRQAP